MGDKLKYLSFVARRPRSHWRTFYASKNASLRPTDILKQKTLSVIIIPKQNATDALALVRLFRALK